MARARRVVALVDGEHYPPVVADAIAATGGVVAALLLGGAEKLRAAPEPADYGVARLAHAHGDAAGALAALLAEGGIDEIVDLSDEPVVTQRSRLRLAAVALHAGVAYRAGGMLLEPERRTSYPLPALAVAGTGKRVGKTAVAGHLARIARDLVAPGEVVVVAMGRGGPAAPELVEPGAVDLQALLQRSRAGQHAASDFLEDALLAGVTAIGCRRCGAGLAGDVLHSTVAEGAALAAARQPALTVFEGSGACLPPVTATRTLLVTSTAADPEEVLGYLGPYRLLAADAVVVVGDRRNPELEAGIRELRPGIPVEPCRLVPRPSAPVRDRRVAVFTTARPDAHAALAAALAQRHGAEIALVSGALADRDALREALALVDAEVFATELKAAAVDVVAEVAAARGAELVFLANEPVAHDGSDALDALLRDLVLATIATNS